MSIVLGAISLFAVLSYSLLLRVLFKLKDRMREAERQLHEKTELLKYAEIKERKVAEQVTLANSSKRQLLNVINHEIRTPLNGILGMVALLDETVLTAEQKDYNGTIRSCSETLITTINDIFLEDAQVNASADVNKRTPEQRNFDLRNSIEEVFELFATQTAKVNLELVYQVDPRIPLLLIGDHLRFRQVLMNLVENAITFTREGEILVKVYVREETAAGVIDLGFEVHDNGLGMPSDLVKLLSGNLHATNAAHMDNTLLLCKRTVTLMGGELVIESAKGKGTIAKFNLPAQKSGLTHPMDLDMSPVHGKRILVVEDNAALRDMMVATLEQLHIGTVVADSGAQALKILDNDKAFDLLIVEMQMPEMDGMVLSQSIRRDHPSIPIILLSVVSDLECRKHPALFSSVVMKPVRNHILSQHILKHLTVGDGADSEELTGSQKLSSEFAEKNPLTILIAEDNRVNQKLAMRVLTKLGYDPDIVQNGKEVLEEVSKVKYDLILMDVQMPEMDGLEATRMVRLCLTDQPVIIAMTANAMEGDREACLQAGMDDYISKPVHLEELVIILEKWALRVKEKS
jgi:CheY-like chemotaxis protein